MRKKFVLTLFLILALFCSTPMTLSAQSGAIDTIVVDLATDTGGTATKVTPALDLKELRQSAREDSLKTAQTAEQKLITKQKELELIKEKRLKEKKEKEKKLKELAVKRKKEKEAREKAFVEKKAKQAKAEAIKKEEKKRAKQKAKLEKQAKQEKKKAEVQKAKQEKEAIAKKQEATKEKAAKISTKEISRQIEEPIAPVKQANQESQKNNSQNDNAFPTVPLGVEQKDNIYGTVRLAYDEQAASFLLSIPTETKMHYHKEHSEQILLIEGEGMVLMGYKTIKLRKNELIFITKGTPHKIINSGRGKLKVLSIQAPFYNGTDKIILE